MPGAHPKPKKTHSRSGGDWGGVSDGSGEGNPPPFPPLCVQEDCAGRTPPTRKDPNEPLRDPLAQGPDKGFPENSLGTPQGFEPPPSRNSLFLSNHSTRVRLQAFGAPLALATPQRGDLAQAWERFQGLAGSQARFRLKERLGCCQKKRELTLNFEL